MKRIILMSVFIFGAVSFSWVMSYCIQNMQLAQAEPSVQESVRQVKKAEDIGNKICPVSAEAIDEKLKSTYEYEGKIYNFCCAMCITDFKKDPQKYIKKIGEEKPKEANAAFSGRIENGIRVIELKAYRYKFEPDPIVVKKGEKIHLILTSADVTHGLSIPEFKINLAAPLGKISRAEFVADKAGNFTTYCSVYCGSGHGKMQGKLIVK